MPSTAVDAALLLPGDAVGPRLTQIVEDQWFDRKSSRVHAKDLAPLICGLANAEGGVIVVGLRDGRVEGTDADAKRRNAQMQAGVDFCVPPVRLKSELVPCVNDRGDEDHLLVLRVETSDTVHATQKDEVYLRIGDETRKLDYRQRQELEFDKGQSSYEARPLPGLGFGDLDADLVSEYTAALKAEGSRRLLRARGLADGDALTIAGALLFATYPQGALPEAFVRVLRYRGTERGTGSRQQLLEDSRFEGPIPTILGAAQDFIRDAQPKRRALQSSGKFGDVPLVPEDAWLEGLVNAVVHRSYSNAGDHIRVEIFADRIEISSPGRFPGLVDLTDPANATRYARNPRIARVCSDLRFGQELGEGVKRMFDEMRQAGLVDPIYRQTSGSVQLTLSCEPVDRELEARLPRRAREVTRTLRDAGQLSTGEVAEVLGISRPVAQRTLAELRDNGIVEWVGKSPKDPRAFWRLAPA